MSDRDLKIDELVVVSGAYEVTHTSTSSGGMVVTGSLPIVVRPSRSEGGLEEINRHLSGARVPLPGNTADELEMADQ